MQTDWFILLSLNFIEITSSPLVPKWKYANIEIGKMKGFGIGLKIFRSVAMKKEKSSLDWIGKLDCGKLV